MKAKLADIQKIQSDFKPGYFEAVMAIATDIDGVLTMDGNAYQNVHRQFSLPPKVKGIGTALKAAIAPVAKAVDAVAGTKLSICPACQARAKRMDG